MDGKHVKIWCLQHDIKQRELANKLGLAERTIGGYTRTGAPHWFSYALNGLELELNKGNK